MSPSNRISCCSRLPSGRYFFSSVQTNHRCTKPRPGSRKHRSEVDWIELLERVAGKRGKTYETLEEKEKRKCFGDRRVSRTRSSRRVIVLWRLSVGTSRRLVDSCDVPRRLENLLPLRVVRAARLEAHRVTEWRVDLRTPTRARFLVSFVPQAPLHWCTPARHSFVLGSLHTFSRNARHIPRTFLRCESILSLASTLLEGYQSAEPYAQPAHLSSRFTKGTPEKGQFRNEGNRASAGWTMRKPDRCKGRSTLLQGDSLAGDSKRMSRRWPVRIC